MEAVGRYPDSEIVASIKSGRQLNKAIQTIYMENYGALSRYIMQNNGSSQDAEDIFQEVVVNFIELVNANRFRGESSIKTILYSMNRFTWLNELKKREGQRLGK